MQTQLGGPLALGSQSMGPQSVGPQSDQEPVPVHFAYVARYEYSDVVVQNDNFLRLSPYDDRYQTPVGGGSEVATVPAGRRITYPDRLGNVVNRIRITAPHRELIIAATGRVCLNDHAPVLDDAPLGPSPTAWTRRNSSRPRSWPTRKPCGRRPGRPSARRPRCWKP